MSRARSRDAESALPLKPADFHILMVLLRGDLHGYGIMQAVADESRGRVQLEVGSLYRLMARLTDEGLITESAGHASGRERRRYYAVTDFGRQVARLEARRLADVVQMARAQALFEDSEA